MARGLYQMPGIAETVALDEYNGSHRRSSPAGIVPIGPVLDFTAPHGQGE